jgi:hypothetical protein
MLIAKQFFFSGTTSSRAERNRRMRIVCCPFERPREIYGRKDQIRKVYGELSAFHCSAVNVLVMERK